MNQYVCADVSVSSILPVAHGPVPAAKSSLKPIALLPVNLQNFGTFGEPSAEQSIRCINQNLPLAMWCLSNQPKKKKNSRPIKLTHVRPVRWTLYLSISPKEDSRARYDEICGEKHWNMPNGTRSFTCH